MADGYKHQLDSLLPAPPLQQGNKCKKVKPILAALLFWQFYKN